MNRVLGPKAFAQLREAFQDVSGIDLSADKLSLVQSRLSTRIATLGYESFDAYCHFLKSAAAGEERQNVIDLLTTNETYFFREPKHFIQLGQEAVTRFRGEPMRVWSAACSSGEEPYSIAMTLLDRRPTGGWEVLASDLSSRVLERARLGVYPMARLEYMPLGYLKRFGLRGKGNYDGTFRVTAEVRNSVRFYQHNLLRDLGRPARFEIIFLRNVLIYFDPARKQQILSLLLNRLQSHGLLFVGHAEPLSGLALPLRRVADAVFEKTG